MNAGQTRKLCGLGALGACLLMSSAFAEEQKRPLAMTYQIMGIRAETAKPAPMPENRCAALTWVASIGACGRDLLAKILPRTERAARHDENEGEQSASASDSAVAAERRVAASPAPRTDVVATAQLPALGSAEPRAARDASLASNRSADLLLRVGSKHRYKGNDESFTDANYQAHVQNNSHKTLGVELLVPFQ